MIDSVYSTSPIPQSRHHEGEELEVHVHYSRLVCLLPFEAGQSVHCKLSTVNLDRATPFEALSYVWGDNEAKETIFVNDKPFQVNRNLFEALINLQRADCERVLWIDAICINQQDVVERNDQVQRMADIYRRAERVLVWLGLETAASRDAFDFLAKAYWGSPNNRQELMNDYGWVAMRDLYRREYWERVWIIQEVCLATRAVIVCGKSQIPWDYISKLRVSRNHIWTRYLSAGELDFRRSLIARLDDARIKCRSTNCTLWTLFESFRDSKCHDIHDKVYGVIGLAADCLGGDLLVDYSKSTQQLFEDVLCFYQQKFKADTSSPHSAQLMRLAEFLQGYLSDHPQYQGEFDSASSHDSDRAHSTCFSISASAVLVVGQTPGPEQIRKFGVTELVGYVDGTTTYSHLSIWREKVDAGLSTIYAVDSLGAFASLQSTGSTQRKSVSEPFHRPSVVLADLADIGGAHEHTGQERPSSLHAGSSAVKPGLVEVSDLQDGARMPVQTVAIVPPGTCTGDLILTFVDSEVALIIRETRLSNGYILVGRAQLDFERLQDDLLLKSRLTPEKTVEMAYFGDISRQQVAWPATVHTRMSTLQVVTRSTRKQRLDRREGPYLELMPSERAASELTTSVAEFQSIAEEQRRQLREDPQYSQILRAPYAGIWTVGSTGYVSCTLQILYHLKPVREAILGTNFGRSQQRSLVALQDLFRSLQRSSSPVSPSALVESFGWESRQIYEMQDCFEFWKVFWDNLTKHSTLAVIDRKFFSSTMLLRSASGQWTQKLSDRTFDAAHGHFIKAMSEACGRDKATSAEHASRSKGFSEDSSKSMEFLDLPPILVLEAKFYQYSFEQDKMITIRSAFTYPRTFDFADVAVVSNAASSDTLYQLHGVVVLEDVKPTPRYMLYLRPREEDRWMLFFNETVTYASSREVFEDNFPRGEGGGSASGVLRTPTIFIYLRKSMLGEVVY